MKTTAVIMAGGRGERFWPKSRNSRPKQFLSLTSDGETMIQKTVKRLLPIVDMEDIYIVTNAAYKQLVLEQIKGLPEENILAEPCARNTAPCIAFASAVISRSTTMR
jgi:mannose-1-phosphate guanylyltransferase